MEVFCLLDTFNIARKCQTSNLGSKAFISPTRLWMLGAIIVNYNWLCMPGAIIESYLARHGHQVNANNSSMTMTARKQLICSTGENSCLKL